MDFFDDDLKGLMGARYEEEETPKQMPTLERKGKPPVDQYEPAESAEEEAFDLWGMVKFPLLFMALVAFLGWTANMELVDPIVAIPSMCVCSACFGWTMKRGDK